MKRRFFLLLLMTGASCTPADYPVDPTSPVSSRARVGTAGDADGVAQQHGRVYQVRVDASARRMHVRTVSSLVEPVDFCPPGDPGCTTGEQFCTLDDPECGSRGYVIADISGEDSVYINPDAPLYEVAEGEWGPYVCPMYVDNAHFEWRRYHFQIWGRVVFQQHLPMTSGIPKARYLLPPGPWDSRDREARIWSGTIDASCFVRQHRVFGVRITEGTMGWYGFRGDAQILSTPGGGGGGGGPGTTWVSYGGSGQGGYIDSDAAQVLEKFFKDGSCTDGWVIIVDGVQEC
jgi:hypothetical protein